MSTVVRSSMADEPKYSIIAAFGGIEYYLDQSPAHTISLQTYYSSDEVFSGFKGDPIPCTVFNASKDEFNNEDLDAVGSKLAHRDDVWTPAFLQSESYYRLWLHSRVTNYTNLSTVIILQTPQASKLCFVREGACTVLKIESTRLLTGPYTIRPSTGEILRVFRLYEDNYNAFIGGSLTFSAQLHSFQWLNTGVRRSDSSMAHMLTFLRTS